MNFPPNTQNRLHALNEAVREEKKRRYNQFFTRCHLLMVFGLVLFIWQKDPALWKNSLHLIGFNGSDLPHNRYASHPQMGWAQVPITLNTDFSLAKKISIIPESFVDSISIKPKPIESLVTIIDDHEFDKLIQQYGGGRISLKGRTQLVIARNRLPQKID